MPPRARSTKYNCEPITDKCRAFGIRVFYGHVQKEMSLASKAKTAVKKSSKAEQRAEMMEQILDVAELLFSKHGFYGVTLKDVAKQVGVHHTLLNYYFDDKQTLFDAVFARRAVVTIEKRMKALDDYDKAAGDSPTVEGALHAFLDFVTGALMLTLARTGRIDKLSDGLCHSEDYSAVKQRMARFMAAGFKEICEQRRQEKG